MPKLEAASLIRGFYGIVNVTAGGPDPVESAAALARGGARCIQLRYKDPDYRLFRMIARGLRETSRILGFALIIDDSAEIAAEMKADGVQVGQDDTSYADARRIVGPDALVGVSTHSEEQLRAAMEAGADYVGFGPIYATRTMENPHPVVGIEGLRSAVRITTVPMVAIGGITLKSAREVTATGVHALASIAGVYGTGDLLAAAASFSSFFPD